MAAVPQKTLNWLWDVLRREYHDPQRTYHDLAQVLNAYPAFAPRTDVYTSEKGVPALLVHLSGTLPVNFRGTAYRFPIAVWVPHTYPYESPIVFVTPTEGMVVRPGQHVSAADGKIYHPYLAQWRDNHNRSTVTELFRILCDVFTREPPVMARPQIPGQAGSRLPPIPPSPQDTRTIQNRASSNMGLGSDQQPPRPPPKTAVQENGSRPSSTSASDANRPGRYDVPPPLPHQPQIPSRPDTAVSRQRDNYTEQNYQSPRSGNMMQQNQPPQPPIRPSSVYAPTPIGPPHSLQSSQSPAENAQLRQRLPQSNPPPHPPPQQPQQNHQQYHQAPLQQAGLPPLGSQMNIPRFSPHQPQQRQQHQQQTFQPQVQAQGQAPYTSQYQQQPPFQQVAAAAATQQLKPQARLDLLDDSPFDVSLSTPSANLPTPAIPPNPQKTALLSSLSTAILQHLHNQIQQSSSALPALYSQHSALQNTSAQLSQEIAQLKGLHGQLSENIKSLDQTLQSSDRVISTARQEQAQNKVPGIDEMIIPPTVVARQLYDAVAEQRGYEAAIWALTEGLVRGRIGSEVWGRKTRECAREEFRRKWLVKRVGRGMGLDMNHS